MTVIDRLYNLIEVERARFENRHNNMCARAFSEIARYRRYLDVILSRHRNAGIEFIENTRTMRERMPPGTGPVGPELWALHLRGSEICDVLHLEIESFYLFAKILLDKVARAIEFYFGPARALALDSHDDLTKRIERYAAAKGLRYGAALIGQLVELKNLVADFRDHRVSHEKSPRTMRGMMCSLDGSDIRMFQSQLYPTSNDSQVESVPIDTLVGAIDTYLGAFVDLISNNRDRTALTTVETPRASSLPSENRE